MKSNDDDKLLHQLFDDEPAAAASPQPVRPAAKPAAPPKVVDAAPAVAVSAVPEDMEREASQLVSELMVSTRRPVAAPKKPVVAPPPEEELLRIHNAPAEVGPAPFSESLAPWTLFRGFAVLAMLSYLVGFHGEMHGASWITLLVITTAITGLVLVFDSHLLGAAPKK